MSSTSATAGGRDFVSGLGRIYGLYTGGFIAFIILMAILSGLGVPNRVIGYLFMGLTIVIYAVIGILSRTMHVGEYYVAGRRVPAIYNGMATGADWMSAASFIGMAGSLYLLGARHGPGSRRLAGAAGHARRPAPRAPPAGGRPRPPAGAGGPTGRGRRPAAPGCARDHQPRRARLPAGAGGTAAPRFGILRRVAADPHVLLSSAVTNLRDLGGRPPATAGRSRRGVVFRSAELADPAVGTDPVAGRARIRTVVDLRTGAEREPARPAAGRRASAASSTSSRTCPAAQRRSSPPLLASGGIDALADLDLAGQMLAVYRRLVVGEAARRRTRDSSARCSTPSARRPVPLHRGQGPHRAGRRRSCCWPRGSTRRARRRSTSRSSPRSARCTRRCSQQVGDAGGNPDDLRPLLEVRPEYLRHRAGPRARAFRLVRGLPVGRARSRRRRGRGAPEDAAHGRVSVGPFGWSDMSDLADSPGRADDGRIAPPATQRRLNPGAEGKACLWPTRSSPRSDVARTTSHVERDRVRRKPGVPLRRRPCIAIEAYVIGSALLNRPLVPPMPRSTR